MNIKLRIKSKDIWLLDELQKIVEIKDAVDVSSSLGFELMRCVRKVLLDDIDFVSDRFKHLLFEHKNDFPKKKAYKILKEK